MEFSEENAANLYLYGRKRSRQLSHFHESRLEFENEIERKKKKRSSAHLDSLSPSHSKHTKSFSDSRQHTSGQQHFGAISKTHEILCPPLFLFAFHSASVQLLLLLPI